MRRGRNPGVTRNRTLSLSIRRFPFFDRGIKAVGVVRRSSLVAFDLGNRTCGCLLEFFALASTFAIVLDDELRADAEKDDNELTGQPTKMRAPISSLIAFGHAALNISGNQ